MSRAPGSWLPGVHEEHLESPRRIPSPEASGEMGHAAAGSGTKGHLVPRIGVIAPLGCIQEAHLMYLSYVPLPKPNLPSRTLINHLCGLGYQP